MFIPWHNPAFRLTGRWSRLSDDLKDSHVFISVACKAAVTTAPGSYFELGFDGVMVVLHFEVKYPAYPMPHLWLSLDGGARFEAPLDRYLRIFAAESGKHTLTVIFKGGMEMQHRWYTPQIGRVALLGAEVEKPLPLPPDTRPLIEFLGDSITEGVLIDTDYDTAPAHTDEQFSRTYLDDNCAAYGFLTAGMLNLRPMFQAYGAIGLTRSGCGGVPRAGLIYPWVFENVPYTGEKPDIVVINHGANDRAQSAEEYLMRYDELLKMIHSNNPKAIIIALSAFVGAFDDELRSFISSYNKTNGTSVHFVSAKGWVPPVPLHPTRSGHIAIANRFAPILSNILKEEGLCFENKL